MANKRRDRKPRPGYDEKIKPESNESAEDVLPRTLGVEPVTEDASDGESDDS